MAESTSWRFKRLSRTDLGWEIVYSKGNRVPHTVEISEQAISKAKEIASGVLVSNCDSDLRELRKLGCIELNDHGGIPEKVSITGLGRQLVIWVSNYQRSLKIG